MTSLLSLRGVSKAHWRGPIPVEVLRDVSLEISPGDFVAIWGGLGSGKTTLLRLAAGLDQPDAGEVVFGGRSLASLSRGERDRLRRSEIGIADRSGPVERELRAVSHVAFPLMGALSRRKATWRAMETIRRLGLDPSCASLRWDELTDGERTLVSIAHAVVREPRLLLVDDPTSCLGVYERERTVALLHRLASEGTAVLMTAPDAAATLGAHEVLTLSSGRLLPAGRAAGGGVVRLAGA